MNNSRVLSLLLLTAVAATTSGCVAVNWVRGNEDLSGKTAPALQSESWIAPEGSTASDMQVARDREGRWAVVAFFRPD